MKKVIVNNISKVDGCITGDSDLTDRAICYIPKKFFKGDEVKAVGCVYLNGVLKPYNKEAIKQDFAFDYLEVTITN